MNHSSFILPLVFAGALSLSDPGHAAVSWHHPLALANSGYWTQRVPLTVTNASAAALAGLPVSVSIPVLTGTRLESLRVCQADGLELLFDVRTPGGEARRTGALSAQDTLVLPVSCAAQSAATLWVYAGNLLAWAVPDYLSSPATGRVQVAVGELERLELRQDATPPGPLGAEFATGADVIARNLTDEPATAALVRVNLRSIAARLPGTPASALTLVRSASGLDLPSYRLGPGEDLLIATEVPARSERRFAIGLLKSAPFNPAQTDANDQRFLDSPANRVRNGSFEQGAEIPDGFIPPGGGAGAGPAVQFGFSPDARFGRRSLELKIAENSRSAWIGWQSQPIEVKPGAAYLLSGWLKATGVHGSATIHAHFHTADGALCRSGAMASTSPGVSGDSDWTHTRGFLSAPPDAATLRLHLTMNNAGTLRHDGVLLCEVLEGQVAQVRSAAGRQLAAGEPLHLWEVNPLIKVFPDTPAQAQARAVHVQLARNEFEPFQLALRARSPAPLGAVELDVSVPTNAAGAALPAIKVQRVGFVPIDYPSGYYTTDVADWARKVPRGGGATDGWAGEWPDPLAPDARFDLGADRTQPAWFTVRAPRDASPGEYRAAIRVRVAGQPLATLPLSITVLPFTLPTTTRLRAIFDLRRGPGGWHGPEGQKPAEREKWLRFIADHRLGIDAIEPPPKFTFRDGRVNMDATEFDATARLCFDELGMNVSYTPQFFYMFGWAYPPKKMFGFEPFTPEWTRAFQEAYRLFTEHLRARGWHDKFVYYISDEPHFDREFVVGQMQRLCGLIHAVDPSLPIYSSTWRHCPAWDNALDVWGVGQHGSFPVAEMERLQRAGKQMWFTCDGQQATDTPYLATERLLPYYCRAYGATGFEFWGLSWWTYDPWKVGWHWFIRQSDDGQKHYWIRYPNGDGYLAYPGRTVGVDGPVSTIRLEQVREGLEDYEAMALLSEAVTRARSAGSAVDHAVAALAQARALVSIPNAGGLRSTEILPIPDRVPAVRRAVNAALAELGDGR